MKKGPKPRQFKVCRDCGIEKPRSEFYKKLTSVQSRCKPCSIADHKLRKHRYRDAQRRLARAWRNNKYRTDPVYRAKIAAAKKARYDRIKDQLNAKRRERWATDPFCAAHKHNRWHDIKNNRPRWVDLNEIARFYAGCPEGYEVDHIIPLKGRIDGRPVSGLHVLWNLQYLSRHENRRKHNRISEATLSILS